MPPASSDTTSSYRSHSVPRLVARNARLQSHPSFARTRFHRILQRRRAAAWQRTLRLTPHSFSAIEDARRGRKRSTARIASVGPTRSRRIPTHTPSITSYSDQCRGSAGWPNRYDAETWLHFSNTKWVNETDSALSTGLVADAVIDQVVAAAWHVSANTRWRRLSRGVAIGILVLAVAASFAAAWAWQGTRRAHLESQRATSRQLAAQAPYFKDEQLDLSLLLATEAYRTDDSPEALVALASVLEHRPDLISSITFGAKKVCSIALSPKAIS